MDETYTSHIAISLYPINKEILKQASELKINGIVAPSIDNDQLTSFTGEELGTGVTGYENINLVIIITEGFGDLQMNKNTRDLLQKSEGKNVALIGRTAIRAGVERAKIIISEEKTI